MPVIGSITNRRSRTARERRPANSSVAPERGLARQRRQDDDPERHADHADGDLEEGERDVERGDGTRPRASTRSTVDDDERDLGRRRGRRPAAP